MICTQSEDMKTSVSTESDSPWTEGVDGYKTPPSLEPDVIYRTLRGKVEGYKGRTPEVKNRIIQWRFYKKTS